MFGSFMPGCVRLRYVFLVRLCQIMVLVINVDVYLLRDARRPGLGFLESCRIDAEASRS
jgi:hypothetical protein